MLPSILARTSALPVEWAAEGAAIGVQVVVKKYCVKRIFLENFFCFINSNRDRKVITLKTFFEPQMTAVVVVQEKDGDRRPLSSQIG